MVQSQLREIIESTINRQRIGLVFTQVKEHETGAAPGECTVGLVIVVAYQVVHASRIGVAYLMVAPQKDDGLLCSVDGIRQTVNHSDGMLSAVRFREAIAIEYHEIIVHLLCQLLQMGQGLTLFVQVIEDKTRKVLTFVRRRAERIVRCAQRVRSEVGGISSFGEHLHDTNAIVIAGGRFQMVEEDVVLNVVAHLLAVEYRTGALHMQRVGAVFYPAMTHAVGLEHDVH